MYLFGALLLKEINIARAKMAMTVQPPKLVGHLFIKVQVNNTILTLVEQTLQTFKPAILNFCSSLRASLN